MKYPRGRLKAQLADFTGQVASPEGDFQIFLIQRVIIRARFSDGARQEHPGPSRRSGEGAFAVSQSSFPLRCLLSAVLTPSPPTKGGPPSFCFPFCIPYSQFAFLIVLMSKIVQFIPSTGAGSSFFIFFQRMGVL